MRVYLAAAEADLRTLRDEGRIDTPLTGFAATASLVDALGLEGEELDLALAMAAAELSRDLAIRAGAAHGRRLVVVAELPEWGVRVDADTAGEISLRGALEIARVDAVLVDAAPLELAAVDDADLAWYAVQELDLLC